MREELKWAYDEQEALLEKHAEAEARNKELEGEVCSLQGDARKLHTQCSELTESLLRNEDELRCAQQELSQCKVRASLPV